VYECLCLALIVLILLTTVLVTAIFRTNVPPVVFADSRILKQDTNQNANCDTVGADSTVSDSCNKAQNGVSINNGGLITSGKSVNISEIVFRLDDF
jgi:hypothetical protein